MEEIIKQIRQIFNEKMQECKKYSNQNGMVQIKFEPYLNLIEEEIIEVIKLIKN